ncbi:MAG: GIY-YIG nuclease family protein [Nostoc sp. DedSLP03]|uniref:GIY-YIG nuclease family protein n=1 Tax=Nostoc sp. DedSLP03 TaxID=3075400 RepID=UPI002AD284A5|nr:GIY-YIG nuclease family protein [Nostoc sp. DedSLP03]MDZ7969847.1 GIY-YIG nuclease family protein [Nostoc sp. DedSLP03]
MKIKKIVQNIYSQTASTKQVMAQGFVYVLLNPSFPDQIKIGLTEQTSELRAKQLRTTGVPTPFIVIYDELVSECELVERKLHQRFAAYRVSSDREFFRIPVREAVRALQE